MDINGEQVLLLQGSTAATHAARVARCADCLSRAGDLVDGINRQHALDGLQPQLPGVMVLQVTPCQEQQRHLKHSDDLFLKCKSPESSDGQVNAQAGKSLQYAVLGMRWSTST